MRSPWRRLCLSLLVLLSVFSLAQARPEADSVILMIGDGMGPNAIELTRWAYGGDPLVLQRMPYSGLVTTRSADSKVTDSAAAATAYATGTKTNNGMLSVAPGGQRLETLLERSRKQGKAAGLITTDPLWGATPAAFAVHVASRGEYLQIAKQEVASGAQVLMGFGLEGIRPKAPGDARGGFVELVSRLRRGGYDIVMNRTQLQQSRKLRLAGFFGAEAPSLAEMTQAALTRLAAEKKGFFLLVEEAGTDRGGHGNDPADVVRSVRSLEAAVKVALEFARTHPRVLVLVTADHETGGLILDAPAKAPMLAKAKGSKGEIASHFSADRSNVAEVMKEWAGLADLTPAEGTQLKEAPEATEAVGAVLSARAGVHWTGGGHTATPVRIFAFGPGAARFTGELDNTQVSARIAEVLGLGAFPQR